MATFDSLAPYDSSAPYDPSTTNVFTFGWVAPPYVSPVSKPLVHLSAQFGLGWDGSFNSLTQDTDDEVNQCVEMICGTTQGQRTVTPKFGLPDVAFTHPDPNLITSAIQQWEPRALSRAVVTYAADGTANVAVSVSRSHGGTLP